MTPYSCLDSKEIRMPKLDRKKFKKFTISLIAKTHKSSAVSFFRLLGFGILEKDSA